MQKAKKEDFRVEEELRSQKAKYEETSEDVYRRMQDIKEAEVDSVEDLTAFLEAELSYHDRCREALVQLKRDWPAKYATPQLVLYPVHSNPLQKTRFRESETVKISVQHCPFIRRPIQRR
jgi:hypothetical protein